MKAKEKPTKSLSLGPSPHHVAREGRTQTARDLRRSQTAAEETLWELLRTKKLHGLKFRRQHPLGQFVADFYCPELRLVIELDGGVHKETVEQDRARDEAITRHNVRVVRLKNREILNQSEAAIEEKLIRLTKDRSHEVAEEKKAKGLISTPSPRDVEREGEARERRECEICGKPLLASQPVLVIANGKVHTAKKALALKNAVFACHASCWNQIENEDI